MAVADGATSTRRHARRTRRRPRRARLLDAARHIAAGREPELDAIPGRGAAGRAPPRSQLPDDRGALRPDRGDARLSRPFHAVAGLVVVCVLRDRAGKRPLRRGAGAAGRLGSGGDLRLRPVSSLLPSFLAKVAPLGRPEMVDIRPKVVGSTVGVGRRRVTLDPARPLPFGDARSPASRPGVTGRPRPARNRVKAGLQNGGRSGGGRCHRRGPGRRVARSPARAPPAALRRRPHRRPPPRPPRVRSRGRRRAACETGRCRPRRPGARSRGGSPRPPSRPRRAMSNCAIPIPHVWC